MEDENNILENILDDEDEVSDSETAEFPSLESSPTNFSVYGDTDSQFAEEYREHRMVGYSHFEALNKARDWYRKFGAREVLNSNPELPDEEHLGASSRPSLEAEVGFNNLFKKLVTNPLVTDKARAYIVLLCRSQGLDEYFSETNWDLANSITEQYPLDENGNISTKKNDIAKVLGYVKNKNNGTNLDKFDKKFREQIKNVLSKPSAIPKIDLKQFNI